MTNPHNRPRTCLPLRHGVPAAFTPAYKLMDMQIDNMYGATKD